MEVNMKKARKKMIQEAENLEFERAEKEAEELQEERPNCW
jgi:hypothetical protein